MQELTTDLLVIGGGINGAGVAADAAGRGLSVILCEKDDLASHTSSASSKLIHGGLRYLEQFELRLVSSALKEREILLKAAPHLVHPLQFVLPYESHLRPKWMIRLGLFLYDHLSTRVQLGRSEKIKFKSDKRGKPLKASFKIGFSYMDCSTDDSRLVVVNAIQAREKDAKILTQTKVISASRENDYWLVEAFNKKTNTVIRIKAQAIVNATGAWVSDVLNEACDEKSSSMIKLVKGSHFIVPKIYEGEHAYILQNIDNRIVFVIPYRKNYSLIGTTDINYKGDPNHIAMNDKERDYLLKLVNHYFTKTIKIEDIVWSYSGVRALYNNKVNNPSKVTREYHLELSDCSGKAPIISVFGGKLTTYRLLAEKVLKMLAPYFKEMSAPWTAKALLPGGNLKGMSTKKYLRKLIKQYPGLPSVLLQRYVESYGSLTSMLLNNVEKSADLGVCFGSDLYAREVNYLINQEWATCAEDIIWRRTKCGIILTPAQVLGLEHYVASKLDN